MLPKKYEWIGLQFEAEGDADDLLAIGRELESAGNREAAALVYDRAYGIDPGARGVLEARVALLNELSVVEHGLRFRYIPGGVFLMGCDTREEDERPWHPVWLSPYWMMETPMSWADYCRLMDWEPAPDSFPRDYTWTAGFDGAAFHLREENKVRLQYCEDRTTQARDWHAHAQGQMWQQGGVAVSSQELFGTPARDEPDEPWEYSTKPMVAVAWQSAAALAVRLSTKQVRYACPTEAQWEKAARGGLIGARYAWGDEPPKDRCDYGHFGEFSISPMTKFPPNGYGLYAMNGGVWEWTADWYDCDYYKHSPDRDPQGPEKGEEKVLRGGSWADCEDAVTVSFRMSRAARRWEEGQWSGSVTPNIGFRLCRIASASDAVTSHP